MVNEYPQEVRRQARNLWLTGRYTDEQIAAELKLPRADTIRDWRREEGWVALARDLSKVLNDEVRTRVDEQRGAFRAKYDQLGQVPENRAVRHLSDPNLPPRDLKAIAGTLAVSQKIRNTALGEDQQKKDKLAGTVAGLFRDERRRQQEEEHGRILGRCREEGAIEDDPPTPADPGSPVPAPEAARSRADDVVGVTRLPRH